MSWFECIRTTNRHDFAPDSMDREEDLPEAGEPGMISLWDNQCQRHPWHPRLSRRYGRTLDIRHVPCPLQVVSKLTRWVAKRAHAQFERPMTLHKDLGAELRPRTPAELLSVEQCPRYQRVCDKVMDSIDLDENGFFHSNFSIFWTLVDSGEYDEFQIMASPARGSKLECELSRVFLCEHMKKYFKYAWEQGKDNIERVFMPPLCALWPSTSRNGVNFPVNFNEEEFTKCNILKAHAHKSTTQKELQRHWEYEYSIRQIVIDPCSLFFDGDILIASDFS